MDVIQTRNSYSEVFELLKYTDRNDLNKIPMNLLKTIKENRNEQYIPKINFNDINNSLSKKARSLYMWLYLTYITDSREEKERINKILYYNEIEPNIGLKLNNNMFKKLSDNKETKENNQLVVYEQNIFKRLIDKIIYFLKDRRK